MKNIVGIDLGTTFSAIAMLDESGKPHVVKADSERILPSCIWAESPSALRAGGLAKKKKAEKPHSVASRFKRHMGKDVTLTLKDLGRNITPVEASSHILRKLIQEASKVHGPIEEVVITIPSNFGESERRATMEAGEMAGVKVRHIINEPTAAALAYASENNVNGTIMVYDLGGGTFDVTIAKINGSEVECLTSEGDIDLGGIDFDAKLADIVDKMHEKAHGRTLRAALGIKNTKDEEANTTWQELLLNCEEWKKELSDLNSVFIKFNEGPDGKVQGEVTRAEFEASISSYIARAEMLVEAALSGAKLSPNQIDQVLMVGGSTRIPGVRNSIKKLIGKEPLEAVNVDEAVALGAAIYAGLRMDNSQLTPLQKQRLEKLSVSDVCSHYYGTIYGTKGDEKVGILIEKNSRLPSSKTEEYYTVHDGQKFVLCRITQCGEAFTDPEFVKTIHELQLGPFPEGRPSGQPIQVTYTYTINQVLEVNLLDVSSGKKVDDIVPLAGSKNSKTKVTIPSIRIE